MFNEPYKQAGDEKLSSCSAKKESDCRKFLDVVQLILDDEASEEQIKFFRKHVDACKHCLETYNMEKSVAEAIKSKLQSRCCPDKLVQSIKQKIREASI